jgi:hypothetical protein
LRRGAGAGRRRGEGRRVGRILLVLYGNVPEGCCLVGEIERERETERERERAREKEKGRRLREGERKRCTKEEIHQKTVARAVEVETARRLAHMCEAEAHLVKLPTTVQ